MYHTDASLIVYSIGTPSPHCHLSPRHFYFFMLVWMHWIWRSGRLSVKHSGMLSVGVGSNHICCSVAQLIDNNCNMCNIFLILCSPMKSIALSSTILFLVLVARAAFVFPLSFLANLTKKTEEGKISIKQQVSVLFSSILGLLSSLIRGLSGYL